MSRNKHPPSGRTPITLPVDDLRCNPGIGASRGATRSGVGDFTADEFEDGENSFESGVDDDLTPEGGVTARPRSRLH
jgi:hypothetical protein